MKIILCGYNWIGCRALELLMKDKHDVYVYTSKNPYYVPSLIDYCKKMRIHYTTEKIAMDNLPFKPDMVCSVYYRHIIPEEIISICNGKIFNIHPSLLPKYRGCSSLTWAMINNEKMAGYTYHYIDKGIDTGRIILQNPVEIYDYDTQDTLYKRVMFEAIKDFLNVIELVKSNFTGKEQVGEPSFYKRGCPYDGIIDENWNDDKVERFIRAMIAPPMPVCKFNDNEIHSFDEYKIKKHKENEEL